jgi:hypothetical protein
MKKLIAICAFLLTACAASLHGASTSVPADQNLVKDGGLLSKKPCGPPCFNGIIPGVTTEEEAAATINKLQEVFADCKTFDFTSSGGYRGVKCASVNIGYKNSLVEQVSFTPSSMISVQQIIDLYGPPDSVTVVIDSLPDFPNRTSMALYFDSIQTMIGVGEQNGVQFTIQPTTGIASVIYLSEQSYNETRSFPNHQMWRGYNLYVGTR